MGMCLGFLPHNMHPARIFMGDSGSMLIGLILAAGAISITGQIDPDALKLFAGSERSAVHATVPVYIPLLLPLTIIAIPAADLVLAIVRRTWRGQSPFAADRGHLHHRLLEIGHSHSRAVLIMYFWCGLIAFGALSYSVTAASMLIVLSVSLLSALGLVLLLMPRFTPRAPRWAERMLPPRYRRPRPEDPEGTDGSEGAEGAAEGSAGDREATRVRAGAHGADSGAEDPVRQEGEREPVGVGATRVANGSSAVGHRSRFRRPGASAR
jgi:UDP-GlcNAc:undecaprenyl-phosphate GlcNAc-1-phosphate transferase